MSAETNINAVNSANSNKNETVRLFDVDSYVSEFEAKVISCAPVESGYETVLDRTAFFPEGGGQASDEGKLGAFDVLHVREENGVIYHLTKEKFEPGARAMGKVDFKERFRRMQNHTAEHILSGVIHTEYGFHNVGFHLSEKYIRADYNGALGGEDIKRIETLVNNAIVKNHPVTAWYPEKNELLSIEYRSKKEIEGRVRLVKIEDVDICACCAPHVSRTGEIGAFKVTDYMKYKGGTRIFAVAGSDAVSLFISEHEILSDIAESFSVKREEAREAVSRLSERLSRLKSENIQIRRELLKLKSSNVEYTDGNLCFFFDSSCDVESVREFLNSVLQKCGGVCAGFIGDGDSGYRYIIVSERVNLKDKCRKINDALCGKGGGSDKMICGSANAEKGSIESFFKDFEF